jgi:hypothetical protein
VQTADTPYCKWRLNDRRRYVIGGMHALIHLCIATVTASLLSPALAYLREFIGEEILYFLAFGIGMILAGIVGGSVWGLYLLAISVLWGMHANDAFSAMRLGSYRHFLRLRIKGDEVTVFPVGLDKAPQRDLWIINPKYRRGDQDEPAISPKESLGQRLIEEPVVIDARQVVPLKRVAAQAAVAQAS